MPDSKDCGLHIYVSAQIEATGQKKKAEYSRSGSCRNSRSTLEHNDSISEISGHDEIVLDDESGLLIV